MRSRSAESEFRLCRVSEIAMLACASGYSVVFSQSRSPQRNPGFYRRISPPWISLRSIRVTNPSMLIALSTSPGVCAGSKVTMQSSRPCNWFCEARHTRERCSDAVSRGRPLRLNFRLLSGVNATRIDVLERRYFACPSQQRRDLDFKHSL
jgi:hypothetical protein